MCVEEVFDDSTTVSVRVDWHEGAEPEEDVGRHAVDPEHEGEEGVEDEVANTDTQTVVVEQIFIKHFQKKPTGIIYKVIFMSLHVPSDEADICKEVVYQVTDGYFINQSLVFLLDQVG